MADMELPYDECACGHRRDRHVAGCGEPTFCRCEGFTGETGVKVHHLPDPLPQGRYDLADLGAWDADIWVLKDGRRELDICDGNLDITISSRQDCDDLIALLTAMRERLP